MDGLHGKRTRFEMLMAHAEIPKEVNAAYFADGYIQQVEVSRQNREWLFALEKSSLIPSDVYRSFCRMIQEKFAHIAKVRFVLHYTEEVARERVIEEYWQLLLDWVQRQEVSINGWLAKAEMSVQGSRITIAMLDSIGLEQARKKNVDRHIQRFFREFFALDCQVGFQLHENRQEVMEEFSKQRERDEDAVIRDMVSSIEKEAESEKLADAELKLMLGNDIRDVPVPLSAIQDVEKKVTVQGMIFNLDSKELKNGTTLYTFNLTDFTDSILVKAFARTKEDAKIYALLANGKWIKARGKVDYDTFSNPPELMMIPSDLTEVAPPPERKDNAPKKRVEFHLHTTMSTMDGMNPISDYVKTAAAWGMKAIAVTDHSGVQSFPEAGKAAKKHGIKMIYGVEANVVNDAVPIVLNADDRNLADAEYIVFDIETTGLSVVNNKIIEIAGVKMQGEKVVDSFSTFIDPHENIPYNITQLTSITNEMVKGAPDIKDKLPEFVEFIGDCVLVAHNAQFDIGFIQANLKAIGLPPVPNPVLDTLELARYLYPDLKNHRLNTLTTKFKVNLENHHRAVDDAAALGEVLQNMIKELIEERRTTKLSSLNDNVGVDLSNQRPFHCGIYAKNQIGKKNLYKLISLSHTEHFKRVARIPRSKLTELREGLMVISGCEKGELFETVLNKSREEAEQVAEFYDVLEIQPLDMYMHLVDKNLVGSRLDLEKALRTICEIGHKLDKPVIATGNAHYLNPRDKICRDITIHGITGFSPLKDQRKPDAHFRTTEEMLEEFAFLGVDKAQEVVVDATDRLADEFEEIVLFPKTGGPTDNGLFSPIIEGAEEEIRNTCYSTARSIYGEDLPDIVVQRLEKELKPIIGYGFSANYLISERLVKKSNADGYLVGSRGSVGSSFVATMLGISEVNPLAPHYICKACKYSEFFTDGRIPSGFDLPDRPCPNCGEMLKGEGQDIPFETFLGFKGDKVPDIDLNFSGEYQPEAHNYTKVLFGPKNVFRAGTIGTVADKTAFGYTKKYEEHVGKSWRKAEVERLAAGCTGVKRSTGQHPGGIVVVPDYLDVEEITPVQYPADDVNADWMTTHFDYHSFEENLLKLDILGHDDPSMMRMLQDLTGVDPTGIPMNDPAVMSLFSSTTALGVTPEQIRTPVATYGIPEMGTKFVRQMLQETHPSTFADLLQISGLSHGTGVWLGNAQELIRRGICDIKTVIGCRDDIMLYLIYKAGMDAGLAFKITESVRKGRGLTPEWKEDMKKCNVPAWYIDSCEKIEYMFPKAHASAYVISAVRTAYFKLYHPVAFYATYFSVRAEDFDVELFCQGHSAIMKKLIEIEEKAFQATPKEKAMVSILEMGLEMTARGFSFKPLDLYRSDAVRFQVDGDALLPPFSAVGGIGANAARQIAAAKEEGDFLSIEDFQRRSKTSKSIVELLTVMGCFRGLPESNQLSLF